MCDSRTSKKVGCKLLIKCRIKSLPKKYGKKKNCFYALKRRSVFVYAELKCD